MNLFAKYMEKQEILSKLTGDEKFYGYNYSKIHTITAIGDLSKSNVTQIANYKKLLEQDLIETYQLDGNKQKIFFRSTKSGQFLYEEYEKRHNLWLKKDNAFIKQFDQKILEQVEKFMRAFNDYLETQIVELGGNADENWYYIKNYT